jgi:predicted RNA-binding protein with PIN domain
MFRGDIIIDGYNVLYAAGRFLSRDTSSGLEQDRRDLLRHVSRRLSPRERGRTTVVFDARDRGDLPAPPRREAELLVVFADRDGDADVTIERLIRTNSAPRRLCVVSSDHRLQKAARRRRATFLDSDVFLKRLARRAVPGERRDDGPEPAAKHTGGLPASEVEAWLRVFEGVEDVRFPADDQQPHRPVQPETVRRPTVAGDAGDPPLGPIGPRTRRQPPNDRKNPMPGARGNAAELAFWEARVAELDSDL